MLALGSGSLNNVKMTKANRVLNVGSLDTNEYQNSQKFELSSCIKMEEQKEFNKPLFFLNIYLLLKKYFVSIPSLTEFSCNRIFMLFFCLFVMLG